MKRRIFSMLLAVLMMFTTVDISAFAKQAEVATEFDVVEEETGTEVETENNETETEVEVEIETEIANSTSFVIRDSYPEKTDVNAKYYYDINYNPFATADFGLPNCTTYAWGRIYEITGTRPKLPTGNASEWWSTNKTNYAKGNGYSYGSEPRVGAVICYSGHVAVVENIENDNIWISESNYSGRTNASAKFRYRTKAHFDEYNKNQTFYGYIYATESFTLPTIESDFPLIDGAYYYIWNHNAGLWVDVEGTDMSSQLVLNEKMTGNYYQMWKAIKKDDGYVFQSRATNYAWDVQGASNDSGTKINVHSYHGAENQRFKLVDRGNGYYSIHPVCSNLAVDAYNAGTTVGTKIFQFPYNGGNNQLWGFSMVEEPPVISNIKVSNITPDGYDISCTVTDDAKVESVKFSTWWGGANYSVCEDGIKNGDTYSCHVDVSKYDDKREVTYYTDIFAYDNIGQETSIEPVVSAYVPTNKSFITLNPNGGTITMSKFDMTYGKGYYCTVDWLNPTKNGYIFKGWYTESGHQVYDENGRCINDNIYWKDNCYLKYEDLTLQAHWKANEYIVTFDGNGGKVDTLSKKVTYNENYGTLPEPIAEKRIFEGWYTKKEGGERITEESIYRVASNSTLYAHWAEEGLRISEIEPQYYTGNKIKPEVTVWDSKTLLVCGVDYKLSYSNNIKVNDAKNESTAPKVIVKGIGNYAGTETATFEIIPKEITDEEIVVEKIIKKYNSKTQKPIPVIKREGKKLVNKKDFTVEYPDTMAGAYKAPGTYSIIVKGKGGYTGQKTITYTITENVLMSSTTVSKIKDQTYTGAEIKPAFTVKNGKTPLVEETDYKVSYSKNKEIGTATIILTGMGKYSGEKKVTFKIKGEAISKAKVTGVPKQMMYTGSAITASTSGWGDKPTLTATIDGTDRVLTEGTDYTVSYQKNINKGTASIIFTGKNGYSGTLKKTFSIKAYNIFDDLSGKVIVTFDENQVYAKGGSKPKPTVKFGSTALVEGKDYTLSYKNNNKVNDRRDPNKLPIVTIKGKGNYTASVSKSFTIVKQSLTNLTISAPDKVYSKSKGAYKSTPKITDLNNKNLSAGTDFEKNYVYTYKHDVTLDNGTVRKAGEVVGTTDIVPAGTILRVTVTGKGNYADSSITGEYRITKSSITKASVKVASQTYTGKEIKPDKSQITVKIGKQVLTSDDYDIVSYSNNIKKGTAKVTIKGKGNYGGTKTVNFTIKSKGFLWWWR